MELLFWVIVGALSAALVLNRVAAEVAQGEQPPAWSTLGLSLRTRTAIIMLVVGVAVVFVFRLWEIPVAPMCQGYYVLVDTSDGTAALRRMGAEEGEEAPLWAQELCPSVVVHLTL